MPKEGFQHFNLVTCNSMIVFFSIDEDVIFPSIYYHRLYSASLIKNPYVLFTFWRYVHSAFQRMPGPRLKIIILAVNYMPIGQSVSIRVKIILVMVYNLPALLVILCGAVCIPPAITIMVPAHLILRPLYQ